MFALLLHTHTHTDTHHTTHTYTHTHHTTPHTHTHTTPHTPHTPHTHTHTHHTYTHHTHTPTRTPHTHTPHTTYTTHTHTPHHTHTTHTHTHTTRTHAHLWWFSRTPQIWVDPEYAVSNRTVYDFVPLTEFFQASSYNRTVLLLFTAAFVCSCFLSSFRYCFPHFIFNFLFQSPTLSAPFIYDFLWSCCSNPKTPIRIFHVLQTNTHFY